MKICKSVSVRWSYKTHCSFIDSGFDGGCFSAQYTLNLCGSCGRGRMPPLTSCRQRDNSVKHGQRRCRVVLTAAVAERIVRWKLFGNGIQRDVRQMMSHRQVDGSPCSSWMVFRRRHVIPAMAPAWRRIPTDVIWRHRAQSPIRQSCITRHRQGCVAVGWRTMVMLVDRADRMCQRRRVKVYGVASRWRWKIMAEVVRRLSSRTWTQSVMTTHMQWFYQLFIRSLE